MLVNLLGALLIALIVWWFWLSRPRAQTAGAASVTVLVENGVYNPARIEARVGEPLVLRFVRKDAGPCAAKVIFEKLQISADLPLGKSYDLHLTPLAPGEYAFTCEMQMYRGSLVVK